MRCDSCRELLSADLDGHTDDPLSLGDALDHHDGCPDCRHWYAAAVEVNRLVRVSSAPPSPSVPADRLEAILAELPSPRRHTWWWTRSRPHTYAAARIALALTGLVQAVWGGWSLLAGNPVDTGMGDMSGDGMVHMSHEYSSWVTALGIAFIVGAGYVRHLAGALPALGCFVGLLGIVSLTDLAHHRVDPTHVASHVLLAFAFVLMLVILRTRPTDRPGRRTGVPLTDPSHGRLGRHTRASTDRDHGGAPPARDPAARYRAA
jgi:predicted anti-sigma-YlaC factor YlaD